MTDQAESSANRISTLPSVVISVYGIPSEEFARSFGKATEMCLRECGKWIDLRTLDGVTIAEDYSQALKQLDRGYQSNHVLTPTKDIATGVAMSPRVLRGDRVKTHIFLDADVFRPLVDMSDPGFAKALNGIAHECAHVQATARFDSAFPGVLLRHKFDSFLAEQRWCVILPAWEEYAACRNSYGIGADQTDFYEQNFLEYLAQASSKANAAIITYRQTRNGEQLLTEVYRLYGDVLKFASYYLGNLAGARAAWEERSATCKALTDSWFLPYFKRLDACLTSISERDGEWVDQSAFEAIGDIIDDMVQRIGIYAATATGGGVHVRLVTTMENAFLN